MSNRQLLSPRLGVLLAAGVIAVLGSALAVRLAFSGHGAAQAATPPPVRVVTVAPPATVPAPKALDIAALSIPCWSCPNASDWALRFRTDLDFLAPLGNGPANAGEWLAAFAKPNGPRVAEAEAIMSRRVELPGHPEFGPVLPASDPFLAEAAPWCDQATMRFYPDIFPMEGFRTRIPNLLLALVAVRSWVARGTVAERSEDAMADFRRVIRLGRLLRQEDTILIGDLVGLAAIRIGAEAIYDRARRDGRLDLAMTAAVIAAEAPPQKLLTAARLTSAEILPYLHAGTGAGRTSLELPDRVLELILMMATQSPDRRFRCEAVNSLAVVAVGGSPAQRTKAKETLEMLSTGADAVVAANARWYLANPISEKELGGMHEELQR
jgi:hypothetical protein